MSQVVSLMQLMLPQSISIKPTPMHENTAQTTTGCITIFNGYLNRNWKNEYMSGDQ